MNILELDSYNLADAVKFNQRLNPRLWTPDEQLKPDVRKHLLEIADDFREFLGVSGYELKDITVSGSNAAYTYTPHSDIDLHLVVDLPQADTSEVYRELFDAKKFQYNEQHDITIGGSQVELYVQNANKKHISQGIYSVLNDEWIEVPKRRDVGVDDISTRSKYEDLSARIDSAVESGDYEKMAALMQRIKNMRQTGLDKHGEFGPENLSFKMLRNQGAIKRLVDARNAARDRELSLKEREQVKPYVKYGFKNEDAGSTWDGVSPSTQTFLNEKPRPSTSEIVSSFINYCVEQLGIKHNPQVKFKRDPQWSARNKTFGRYNAEENLLEVSLADRHVMDILRTVAHELTHARQHEVDDVPDDAGATGSKWENEANARAGILMRDYAQKHPEFFEADSVEEGVRDRIAGAALAAACVAGTPGCATTEPLNKGAEAVKSAVHLSRISKDDLKYGARQGVKNILRRAANANESSGYIPTKKQARDPRWSMALTKDVKPGATGKEANKLNLNTDSQGHPELLMKGLANALREFKETGRLPGRTAEDYSPDHPPGPESKPTMPKGTLRVDVSDVYDWYKLGQHISNLKGLGKHDFGKGPPSSIISFGDEDTEHKFIKDLEATGLDITDIDPRDPAQPAGMKKVKTDPTYNVNESLTEEALFEINMSISSLRDLARNIDARAGMEFEMIVPGVDTDSYGDGDIEPDYDSDQRSRSWADIREFFHDNDYNSRREVDRLIENLQDEFFEWLGERIDENWEEDEEERVWDWVKENASDDDVREVLELPEDHELTKEDWKNFVEYSIENTNSFHQEAYDDYREEAFNNTEEREFLDAVYPNMSDISGSHDIAWPHYYNPEPETDIGSIASDFEDAIGRKVQYSSSYHGAKRNATDYVIEPDSSLDPDNSGESGLEFISPPLPLDEMLDDLEKVVKWAGRVGAYTNDSTGLHMNVSIPDLSTDKLDYVKLALLLGDEYVLDQFGRSANTYTKSAMRIVRDRINQRPEDAAALLKKMKDNLEAMATKIIHSGETQKYTSINTKGNYIEFRSPGGDWLGEYAANVDKLENTLLRFVVATDAAMDPKKYRQEYLKKLYKVLSPNGSGKDTLEYFAKYVAGEMPKEDLKSFIKQAQLERKVKKGDTGDEKFWWEVSRPGYMASIKVVASSKEEAIRIATQPENYPDWASAANLEAKPVAPYNKEPVRATVGEPQAVGQRSGPTVNGRPSNPDGNYVITPESDRTSVYYRFMAANIDDANIVLRQWRQEHPDQVWLAQRDDNQTLGQPAGGSDSEFRRDRPMSITPTGSNQSVKYEMFSRETGQVYRTYYAADDEMAIEIGNRYRDEMVRDSGMTRGSIGLRRGPLPGSTVDLQRQRAAQAQQQEPQPAASTQQPGGEFTGQWIIKVNGQEIHRLSGIGNNQGDANRKAQEWLLAAIRNGRYNPPPESAEIEVVPEMR